MLQEETQGQGSVTCLPALCFVSAEKKSSGLPRFNKQLVTALLDAIMQRRRRSFIFFTREKL